MTTSTGGSIARIAVAMITGQSAGSIAGRSTSA
jgi:hypothetical protein